MENPNYGEAVKREADREDWRIWYNKISTRTLKHINTTRARQEPRQSDRRVDNMLLEPPDLVDLLAVLVTTFHAAAATSLDALIAFKVDPKESLQILGLALI